MLFFSVCITLSFSNLPSTTAGQRCLPQSSHTYGQLPINIQNCLCNSGLYLLQCVAELKDLSFSFHLPHTQFAADVCDGRAQSLQGEGAVKTSLTAAPHLVERDLLKKHGMHMLSQSRLSKEGNLMARRHVTASDREINKSECTTRGLHALAFVTF